MKKFVSALLCLVLLVSMGGSLAFAEGHPKHLTVVATTYPLYDMAYQIGGGHLNVVYHPEVDAEILNNADILLCMGGEEEAWLGEVDDVIVLFAKDGIEAIPDEANLLTIPVNNMIAASYFVDALTVADESHINVYMSNYEAYTNALIELDSYIRKMIIEGTKVYCEDGSMAYFAMEYGVEISDTSDGAIVMHTFEHPAEEDLAVPYIELMRRNLETLADGE